MKKLTKRHKRILNALEASTDPKGERAYELSKRLGWRDSAGAVSIALATLQNNGYLERRKQGEPWPGEQEIPDEQPDSPERPRAFYRIARVGTS